MEERFDEFICPNCGKQMAKGITFGAQRPTLIWYPGRNAPSAWDLLKLPDARSCQDNSNGVMFSNGWSWLYSCYRPAWYCHECGLLLVDTKTVLEKI